MYRSISILEYCKKVSTKVFVEKRLSINIDSIKEFDRPSIKVSNKIYQSMFIEYL